MSKMPTAESMAADVRSAFADFPCHSGWSVEERMLPAPDGVMLRTRIFRPTDVPPPWPTIVQRSCYPQNELMLDAQGEEYAKRGFAMVYQMCRGTCGSQGVWEPNIHEREDGLSLVNWIQEQPWAESMGYFGSSYLALTGWAMADAVPEKMKTMYLTVYGTARHTSAWQDGLFRQDILTAWTMSNAGHPVTADYIQSAQYRPQIHVDEALWGGKLQWYRDWITHPDPADPYWKEGFWAQLQAIPGKLKIPIFLGEGWYDHHVGSALAGWETLSAEAKEHSVLQICPGNHGLRPAIFGHPDHPNAVVNSYRQSYQWFRQILMDHSLPEPQVQVYEVGSDRWKSFPSYPFPVQSTRCFYLNGRSLSDQPGENGIREYDYDPENPVPSLGGETMFVTSFTRGGSREIQGPDWRDDVLSFVSEPLTGEETICGKIKVHLYVQSDAPDTCFAVKISEVFPDGRAFHIRNAITTLGWNKNIRHHYDGSMVELELETIDIAWKLGKGSRLRLDVSSSNFPEYSVHPNTGELWSEAVETRVAHQKIYFGKDYPARVILPR